VLANKASPHTKQVNSIWLSSLAFLI